MPSGNLSHCYISKIDPHISAVIASMVRETTNKKLYKSTVDDDLFDDACDLGQFFLNPMWYLYLKANNLFQTSQQNQRNLRNIQSKAPTKHSSWIHLQQPLYFTFLTIGWGVVFIRVYPLIRASEHLSNIHVTNGYLVFAACLLSWKFASSASPGNITPSTMQKFDNYPYDGILYEENSTCPTLNQRKLARSKYDRFTQKHVPRFDHFCGWLRQPIGEENYRHFLMFVAVHALMCGYGCLIIASIIQDSGKETTPDDEKTAFGSKLRIHASLSMIMCFLGLVAVTLLSFFGFHMYLISRGMTTNEYYKWKLITSRHEAAKARYLKSLNRDVRKDDEEDQSFTSVNDPGSFPANIYDQGLINNFLEILYPRSLFGSQDKDK